MNFKFILFLSIMILPAAKAEIIMINNSDIYISGIFLKAYNVAYDKFKQKGYDVGEHYVVALKRTDNSIEVSFILDPTFKERKILSNSKIEQGEEMNYTISLKNFQIIEEWGMK